MAEKCGSFLLSVALAALQETPNKNNAGLAPRLLRRRRWLATSNVESTVSQLSRLYVLVGYQTCPEIKHLRVKAYV